MPFRYINVNKIFIFLNNKIFRKKLLQIVHGYAWYRNFNEITKNLERKSQLSQGD